MNQLFKRGCGFEDVRRNTEGMYYCQMCGKVMPPEYELTLKQSVSADVFKAFVKRCEEPARFSEAS